jgi:hypothetical protein
MKPFADVDKSYLPQFLNFFIRYSGTLYVGFPDAMPSESVICETSTFKTSALSFRKLDAHSPEIQPFGSQYIRTGFCFDSWTRNLYIRGLAKYFTSNIHIHLHYHNHNHHNPTKQK